MLALFEPIQYLHEHQFSLFNGLPKPNSKVAERAKILNDAILKNGNEIDIPKSQGIAPVYEVHSPDYLEFLKNIYIQWQKIPNASPEVISTVHPNRKAGGITESPI